MRPMPKAVRLWFIAGFFSGRQRIPSFYTGGHQTRGEAMRAHCGHLGKTWTQCQDKGDFAVRCHVAPEVTSGERSP